MSEYRLIARLNDNAQLEINTPDLAEMGRALVFFGLANDNKAPEAAAPAPAEAPAVEDAAPKTRKPRAPKPEAAATTTQEPAAATSEPAAAPATAEGEQGNAAAAPSAPETAAAPSASSDEVVTPAQAAEAVRGYGAKHGILAARELLQKHGFAKTGDITPEKAAAVFADASKA